MALEFNWQDGDRVLFLGHADPADPQSYVKLVPALVTARYPERRIDYVPYSIGGDRLPEVVGRVDDKVVDIVHPPTWILLDLGVNDVFYSEAGAVAGTPLGRFRELYTTLIEKLLPLKASLACLTTGVIGEDPDTPMNQALVGYNDAIREIAFRFGATVVDINADFHDAIARARAVNPAFRFTTDGVHPNLYGHYLITLSLLRAMHFAP